jgi:hypothetical protein
MSDTTVPVGGTAKTLRGFDTGAGIDEYVRLANPELLSLTARMKAFQPASGYRIWGDTAGTYAYLLEAPLAATSSSAGFRGIRMPIVAGALVGKIEENAGGTLTFDNRATDTGWT